jgi:DNA polymerase
VRGIRRLWFDCETRSRFPIRHGTVRYSKDVRIMICAWCIEYTDGTFGPIVIVDLMREGWLAKLQPLIEAAKIAQEIWAHNAEFDRVQLETTKWWPKVPLSKWRCTMALARLHGLPGALDKLCIIFNLPASHSKGSDGKDLIQFFCVPTKAGPFREAKDYPKQWAEFLAYGGQDVTAMIEVWRKTPKWNATSRMWSFWHLDQKMNTRGVEIDLKLAECIIRDTTKAKRRLAKSTAKIAAENPALAMANELESTTQVARLKAYLADFGIDLPDLSADTIERRLEDESLPEHIKELLRIRQQASKASTAKCQRAVNQHVAGRLYNLLVFCGAMRTGRWAGRTLQPQNFPRPKFKPWEINLAIDLFYLEAIELHDPDNILGLASSCLRGLVIAAKNCKLVTSDLKNIEGRFMAWIAGEEWKLEAFRAYDRGEGPDLYKVSYAKPFDIDPNDIADEGDWRRQIGKVMELALQYYGGVGAFCSMAETYHLNLEDMAKTAWPVIPDDKKAEATGLWHKAVKRRRTYGLNERVWVVCQALVLMWREAHPAIVQFWKDLEVARKAAVYNPGKVCPVGKHIQVDRRGNWLRFRLPSGRYLCYPAPRHNGVSISFMGVNPYTKQWGRISTYSGKDAENITQGGSADVIMDGLLAAEDAGYHPVLSVHDEAITEPPDQDEYTDERLSELLVNSSAWASGLPLAAKGDTAYRYGKH